MSSKDPTGGTGRTVVGVDGSATARHALTWAAAKADALGPITPVHVLRPPLASELAARLGREIDLSDLRRRARECLAETVAATDPALLDRAEVLEGNPGPELCRAASDASLLVVGTRGHRAATAGLLGSTSSFCARHSPVPVAVIPPDSPADGPLTRAVVGIDGSIHGDNALRWAIDHVEPDGHIRAVGALPVWDETEGVFDPSPFALERLVRQRVEDAVGRVVGRSEARPAIEVVAVAKDARVVLRNVAEDDADVLVVGARGLGTIPFLLLGSVSAVLSHHPSVPTVIVRHDTEE